MMAVLAKGSSNRPSDEEGLLRSFLTAVALLGGLEEKKSDSSLPGGRPTLMCTY